MERRLRIVIPGGSGQIGQALARHLHEQGHAVTVLSRRSRPAAWPTVGWNGRDLGPWLKEIDGAHVVINLAGRSVNCRYTAANRREIMDSRIQSTVVIGEAIAQVASPPQLWMNASTATIYRHALDRPIDECSGELGGNERDVPAAWRFSIDVAMRWEQTLFAGQTPRTRKIALRSAIVLGPARGGIFNLMLKLVRAGLGGRAASGGQYVSWIHEADFVRAMDFLIAHENIDGCVNICAPQPLPQRDFMSALRQACGIRFGLPARKWMLEIGALLLRTETELLLKSRWVLPGRLLQAGFQFSFPEWRTAARDLVRSWQQVSCQPR